MIILIGRIILSEENKGEPMIRNDMPLQYGNRYNKYSEYLREKYGEKAYKIPINLDTTCPNRDGSKGFEGCIFCSDIGAGFESHDNKMSVGEQVIRNIDKISKKYSAYKFIIYFQNFTNTYISFPKLAHAIGDAVKASDGRAVEVCISTRPDCLSRSYAISLQKLCSDLGVNLTFELGLQSANGDTLRKIRRGHGLAEFLDCAVMLNSLEIRYCVHMILGFPWETMEDSIENAKILTALGVQEVKIHSLYILKGTELGRMYESGNISPITVDEYVERTVEFIRHSSPNVVFQRLLGRAPEEFSLFCNWGMSWFKVLEMIEKRMDSLGAVQGDKCNYLDGSALNSYNK